MGTPFLAEIRIVAFNFAPKGWAQCNGQLMPVNQNQPLFSLLGTSFGGDGGATFGLPDFRGRVPIHTGQSFPKVGQRGGEEFHTLTPAGMPSHSHVVSASKTAGNSQFIAAAFPSNQQNIPASVGGGIYGPLTKPTTLHPSSIANAGGSQPHENRQPYTVLNFCVALQGTFPNRN